MKKLKIFLIFLSIILNFKNNREIIIYTDGACLGNPGAGGQGAIIIINKREEIISGGSKETTNNRMEMFAVIEALKKASYEAVINLYTDLNLGQFIEYVQQISRLKPGLF